MKLKNKILIWSLIWNIWLSGYIYKTNSDFKKTVDWIINKISIEWINNSIKDIDVNTISSDIKEEIENISKKIDKNINTNNSRNDDFFSDVLVKEWFDVETLNLVENIIETRLKGKKVYTHGVEFEFTEEFIEKNRERFLNNLLAYVIFLLELESYWWYKYAENENSSAKWPFQWLDGYKNGKKYNMYDRSIWAFTPFETALRRTDMFYNDWKFTNFKSEKTPQYIKDAWNNDWILDLDSFTPDRQLNLLITDLIMRKWNTDEYFAWILLWNYYAAKKIYSKIHHTAPNSELEEKILLSMNNMSFDTIYEK